MIAAFVNATSAHGLELDDTHDESPSVIPGLQSSPRRLRLLVNTAAREPTPSAPSSLAMRSTGRGRRGDECSRDHREGFHPTSLFTGFGATASAARLLGLDPRQLAQTWGLMLSMAGGSMQFSQEPEGTTVKRLHGGYSALHGGFWLPSIRDSESPGPEQAFDGRYGLLANFGANQAPDRLTSRHPDGPEIHRISFKPYPCCRLFHSTLGRAGRSNGMGSRSLRSRSSASWWEAPEIMVTPAHAQAPHVGDGGPVQLALYARRGALLRTQLCRRLHG